VLPGGAQSLRDLAAALAGEPLGERVVEDRVGSSRLAGAEDGDPERGVRDVRDGRCARLHAGRYLRTAPGCQRGGDVAIAGRGAPRRLPKPASYLITI